VCQSLQLKTRHLPQGSRHRTFERFKIAQQGQEQQLIVHPNPVEAFVNIAKARAP
jgi:hypothetical protein